MINLLIDKPPTSVNVEGVDYKVNYLAGSMLQIAILIEDEAGVKGEEAYASLAMKELTLFYPVLPDNLEEAMYKLVDFYTFSSSYKNDKSRKRVETPQETGFSYRYDANLIYAAFSQQYPSREIRKLHWFEFKALLEGLTEDCLFVKVMQYRTMKITSKMPKEQSQFYYRMKELWALPDKRTPEQKDQSFASALFYM